MSQTKEQRDPLLLKLSRNPKFVAALVKSNKECMSVEVLIDGKTYVIESANGASKK